MRAVTLRALPGSRNIYNADIFHASSSPPIDELIDDAFRLQTLLSHIFARLIADFWGMRKIHTPYFSLELLPARYIGEYALQINSIGACIGLTGLSLQRLPMITAHHHTFDS